MSVKHHYHREKTPQSLWKFIDRWAFQNFTDLKFFILVLPLLCILYLDFLFYCYRLAWIIPIPICLHLENSRDLNITRLSGNTLRTEQEFHMVRFAIPFKNKIFIKKIGLILLTANKLTLKFSKVTFMTEYQKFKVYYIKISEFPFFGHIGKSNSGKFLLSAWYDKTQSS
mgnify:CR=1 FL=1